MKMAKKILKILILLGVLAVLYLLIGFGDLDFRKTEELSTIEEDQERNGIIRKESLEGENYFERDFEGTEDEIIALANQARFKEELPEMKRNEKLMASAMAKAQDMKDQNYFEHVSPDGLQPWFFAEKVDYEYKTFGENLAEGFFSAEEVHDGWMNSEGHRENIMSDDFEEIGVAVLDFEQNGLKSYLVVQHFGTQLEKKDLEPRVVCEKDSKKQCRSAEKKMDEVKETIDEQEKIIKDAKKQGATKESIEKAEDNLEKLEEIKKDLKKYLKECDEFIERCEEWK
jgi:uncharacterized protein YkwD